MNQYVKSDVFNRYESKVTDHMCKILRYLFFAVLGVWVGTLFGIFNAEHFYIFIPAGFIVCYLPSLLLKLNVSKQIIKNLTLISISLVIGLLLICNSKIEITFMIMPVLATMYFDKKLIIKMSVINYIIIITAIYIVAPRDAVAPISAGIVETAMQNYIELLMSYTLELTTMTVVLISISSFARKLMENLSNAEKEMQKLEIAEASSKAKTEFLATMSHEIRTPMNAIIGVAQIQLQKNNLPDEHAMALNKIYASGTNLLGIINDILDMSKIESGKFEINNAEYDLPSLIHDAVQLNIVRIGSKQIEFLLDIDKNLPSRIIGDELRLKQILNNLLSNGIKYTNKGFVKLSISHHIESSLTESFQKASQNLILQFIVEDSGQGMKPEDQQKLFSQYLRFNTDANRTTEGTGLGLNITRKLIEMMNGTISVQSEYGKGSKFIVEVKQQEVECAPIGAELAERLANFTFSGEKQITRLQMTRYPMPYGKVLVVDDVDTNLYVAEGLLAPYELKVETAVSGFETIEKIESGNVYDIIFMDHMMPQMDGIQTTQKLREAGYTGTIVALTANAIVGNDEMFKQNGFDGFIAKPIDLRQLNAVLNTFVRDKYPEEAGKYSELADLVKKEAELYPKIISIFCVNADKTIVALRKAIQDSDIKLITSAAHSIKPSLAYIGENEASNDAFNLEKAGLDNNIDYIHANTDNFIKTLETLIQKLSAETDINYGDSNVTEDMAYLTEQLKEVQTACQDYNAKEAYAILDKLKEKQWKPKTSAALEKIKDALFLHSDFEGASKLIQEKIADR